MHTPTGLRFLLDSSFERVYTLASVLEEVRGTSDTQLGTSEQGQLDVALGRVDDAVGGYVGFSSALGDVLVGELGLTDAQDDMAGRLSAAIGLDLAAAEELSALAFTLSEPDEAYRSDEAPNLDATSRFRDSADFVKAILSGEPLPEERISTTAFYEPPPVDVKLPPITGAAVPGPADGVERAIHRIVGDAGGTLAASVLAVAMPFGVGHVTDVLKAVASESPELVREALRTLEHVRDAAARGAVRCLAEAARKVRGFLQPLLKMVDASTLAGQIAFSLAEYAARPGSALINAALDVKGIKEEVRKMLDGKGKRVANRATRDSERVADAHARRLHYVTGIRRILRLLAALPAVRAGAEPVLWFAMAILVLLVMYFAHDFLDSPRLERFIPDYRPGIRYVVKAAVT